MALGLLEQMQEQGLIPPLLELPHNSPEYLHALIEALRYVAANKAIVISALTFASSPDSRLRVCSIDSILGSRRLTEK